MTDSTDRSARRKPLRRRAVDRRCIGVVGLTLPATVLQHNAIARWARRCGVAVDVADSKELAVAIDAGIHPRRMTAHCSGLSAGDVEFCTRRLGVGKIVVSTAWQVELLAAAERRQRVLLGGTRSSLMSSVLGSGLDVVGLHGHVRPEEHHSVGSKVYERFSVST